MSGNTKNSEVVVKNFGKKIDLILCVGQILMESGADTNRIVRTMKRVGVFLGFTEKSQHIHITYTTIMLNVTSNDNERTMTKFQKCYRHGIDMTIISAMSKLSWRAIEENYTLAKFEHDLNFIRQRRRFYATPITVIGAGVACGGFSLLFGCDILAFIYTSICAMIGFLVRMNCHKLNFNPYASIAISAFTASYLAYFAHFLPTSTPWHPLMACALFIVPGVPLINAVDDLLDNFIVSGMTRATNCFLMVVSMTFGIVLAIKFCNFDFEQFISVMISPNAFIICVIASAISAVGFSTLFNTPPRLLWIVALGAIISVSIRNFLMAEYGFMQSTASLIGSVIVCVLALKVVHMVHTPTHVLTIPSVIPLIPGVLIYRFLFSVINIESLSDMSFRQLMQDGVNASLIILGITFGVAIPNMFFRKYLNKEKANRLYAIINNRHQK